MSPRARVIVVAATASALAAGGVVGIALKSSGSDRAVEAGTPAVTPRPGAPPLGLRLGFRDDPEARELSRAEALYNKGQRARAAAIFARSDSLEARVGAAFAAWPHGTLERMEQLGGLHPRSALVQLHLGLARYWAGTPGAEDAWRTAAAVQPDTPYAVTAGDLLYPRYVRGLPVFIPSFDPPPAIASLPPARQLDALASAARGRDADAKLLYGVGLQRVGRPVSAERVYTVAARSAPADAEAQVAAAVGRFDKAHPERAFARLGPLARRFPHQSTVRFHLGLLLLWIGDLKEAKRQLSLAEKAQPGSPLAVTAREYLDRLKTVQTSG